MEHLAFDNKARRNIKECPCGRSNKDGKFCPYKGYTDKGYCFSCEQKFLPNIQTTNDSEAWRQSDAWTKPMPTPSVNYIDVTTVKQTLQLYENNYFIQFLKTIFENDTDLLNDVINRFSIGTAKGNKTIFWQRDTNGNFRTGQIIVYNPMTGKRNKDIAPNWVHKAMKLTDFNLSQCFFGESQLLNDSKPVAVAEAAKTAAIMTAIEPRYTWIATGGATGLTIEKCKALKGKNVILYPDLGKFEEWTTKANDFKKTQCLNIRVSDLIEKYVSTLPGPNRDEHVKNGFDIADYAIKYNWYSDAKKEKAPTLPLSIDEQILQNMLKSQPLVKNLIESLGLVNGKTLRPFQSV